VRFQRAASTEGRREEVEHHRTFLQCLLQWEGRKQGATVIGVTAGNTDQIAKFSQLECRDKFTVAADPLNSSVASAKSCASSVQPALKAAGKK
jgi:peroxiredoxin